jgi:hypothetical protein
MKTRALEVHMSQVGLLNAGVSGRRDAGATWTFAVAALGLATGAALLAGWAPLGFTVVTVFLFAGPHNWIEARYFLSRLPGRWGRLRGYFLLAFAGVFGLTAAYAALGWLSGAGGWGPYGRFIAVTTWNSILILWVAALVHLRSRQNPRRDWSWTQPVALAMMAVAWLAPLAWGLWLVALHPLIGLWILDRELRRSRPGLRRTYHACLACLPFLMLALWWRLADQPPLPADDVPTRLITRQAGADVLRGVSSHALVAIHAFLETIHYGVWLAAIPLVGLRTAPWRLRSIPLARRASRWRVAVAGLLAMGLVVVLLLWACFLADYAATWEIYFTIALLHVLAEFPFLLRAL